MSKGAKPPVRSGSGEPGARRASMGMSGLQDRTHKGGAVLWFLRKHAPMPAGQNAEIENDSLALSNVMRSVAAAAGASAAMRQSSHAKGFMALNEMGLDRHLDEHRLPDAFVAKARTAARKDRMARRPPPPQARFLHQALVSIGTEIDEVRRAAPTPSVAAHTVITGSAADGAMSSRCRADLRRSYAAHADSECAKLRMLVAQRDAEVETLRKQVEQLHRAVSASRIAAARRKKRLDEAANSKSGGGGPALLTQSLGVTQLMKLKNQFMRASAAVVYDADSMRASYHQTKDSAFEENLRQKIDQHWEEETTMRSGLEEHGRHLQQQTIHRKATEAALFGKKMDILELRAKTLKAESRVTRLANDLRRVYQQLPDVVHQKLEQSTSQRSELKEHELGGLHETYHSLHLKWLSSEELRRQREEFCSDEVAVSTRTATATQLLQSSNSMSETLVTTADGIDKALSHLDEAWNKLMVPLVAGMLTSRDRDVVRSAAEQVFDMSREFASSSEMARESMRALWCDLPAVVAGGRRAPAVGGGDGAAAAATPVQGA